MRRVRASTKPYGRSCAEARIWLDVLLRLCRTRSTHTSSVGLRGISTKATSIVERLERHSHAADITRKCLRADSSGIRHPEAAA